MLLFTPHLQFDVFVLSQRRVHETRRGVVPGHRLKDPGVPAPPERPLAQHPHPQHQSKHVDAQPVPQGDGHDAKVSALMGHIRSPHYHYHIYDGFFLCLKMLRRTKSNNDWGRVWDGNRLIGVFCSIVTAMQTYDMRAKVRQSLW